MNRCSTEVEEKLKMDMVGLPVTALQMVARQFVGSSKLSARRQLDVLMLMVIEQEKREEKCWSRGRFYTRIPWFPHFEIDR